MAQVSKLTPRCGSILIIEDRNEVRGGLLELLELSGFRADGAATGEQALVALAASPRSFALVLLDLRLPGPLSGYDLRARQLADPELSSVPTVVITACEPQHTEREALHSDGWLEKPFRSEALLDIVRRFVIPVEQGD
jgi:DNA-binding response OmpR family regulator